MACMISWSPPLPGRIEPATAIAIPDRISASASTVKIYDDGDRAGDAVGSLARLVLKRADRRGDPVVRKAGRHGDHRDARHVRGELGHVDGLAAADPGDRLVGTGSQFPAERGR